MAKTVISLTGGPDPDDSGSGFSSFEEAKAAIPTNKDDKTKAELKELAERLGIPKGSIPDRLNKTDYLKEMNRKVKKLYPPKPKALTLKERIGLQTDIHSPAGMKDFRGMMKDEHRIATEEYDALYGKIKEIIPAKSRARISRVMQDPTGKYDTSKKGLGLDKFSQQLKSQGLDLSEEQLGDIFQQGFPRAPGATSDEIIRRAAARKEAERQASFERIREARNRPIPDQPTLDTSFNFGANVPSDQSLLDYVESGSDFRLQQAKGLRGSGRKISMYHGSRDTEGFSGAASAGLGSFFGTDDPEYAAQYGNVSEYSATLKNPYQMSVDEFIGFDRGPESSYEKSLEFRNSLKGKGHDSIVVTHRDSSKEFILFNKRQARKAKQQTGSDVDLPLLRDQATGLYPEDPVTSRQELGLGPVHPAAVVPGTEFYPEELPSRRNIGRELNVRRRRVTQRRWQQRLWELNRSGPRPEDVPPVSRPRDLSISSAVEMVDRRASIESAASATEGPGMGPPSSPSEAMGRAQHEATLADISGGGLIPPMPPGGGGGGNGGGDPDEPFWDGDDWPLTDEDSMEEYQEQFNRRRRAEQDLALRRTGINAGREEVDRAAANRTSNAAASSEIRDRYQQRMDMLHAEDQRRSSDRIVRRLGAFGIARTLGGSGQIFAGAMEMFAFQPEERRSDLQRDLERQNNRELRQGELDALQQASDANVMARRDRERRVKDTMDQTRANLKGVTDLDERQRIIDDAHNAVRGIMGGSGGRSGGPMGGGAGGGPPIGGNAPIGRMPGDDEPGGLFGSIAPPPAPPGAPPGGQMPQGARPPSAQDLEQRANALRRGPGMNPLTMATIGTATALEGLRVVSQALVGGFKNLGTVLDVDVTKAKTGQSVQMMGSVNTMAAKGGGALIGAGAGAALGSAFPVVGTAAGALLGGAAGGVIGQSIMEPVIAAIQVGNSILENFTDRSIGAQTLQANINEEMKTFFAQMEAQSDVDPITAEFARERGELQRAILGLQKTLIEEFGDDLTEMVKLLADIARFVNLLVPAVSGGNAVVGGARGLAATLTPFGPLGAMAASNLLALSKIVELMTGTEENTKSSADTLDEMHKDAGGIDSIADSIKEFHSQNTFKDAAGQHRFRSTLGFF